MGNSVFQNLLARPASRGQVRDFDDGSAAALASRAVKSQTADAAATAATAANQPKLEASYEDDGLIWNCALAPHPTGELSFALAEGNATCEDYSRVDVGPHGTIVAVFDGHGGPHAARFAADSLLRNVHRALGTGPFAKHGERDTATASPAAPAAAADVVAAAGELLPTGNSHGISSEGQSGEQRTSDAILSAFEATERELLGQVRSTWQQRPELANTGTCALLAFFPAQNYGRGHGEGQGNGQGQGQGPGWGPSVVVASLGDSRAVLGRRRPLVGSLLGGSPFSGMKTGRGPGFGAAAADAAAAAGRAVAGGGDAAGAGAAGAGDDGRSGGGGSRRRGWRSKGGFYSWGSSPRNSSSGGPGGGLERNDSGTSSSNSSHGGSNGSRRGSNGSRSSSSSWSSNRSESGSSGSAGSFPAGAAAAAAGGGGIGMGFLNRWIGGISAVPLSEEHNAGREQERMRLQEAHPGDPTVVVQRNGAWRVKGIIQITRSFGDFYLKHPEFQQQPLGRRFRIADSSDSSGSGGGGGANGGGGGGSNSRSVLARPLLRSDPSLVHMALGADDRFVILASDGLWDHMSNVEAVRMVNSQPRQGIARYLARTALSRAASKVGLTLLELRLLDPALRRKVYDDITVVVVFLDSHRHPPAAVAAAAAPGAATAGAAGAGVSDVAGAGAAAGAAKAGWQSTKADPASAAAAAAVAAAATAAPADGGYNAIAVTGGGGGHVEPSVSSGSETTASVVSSTCSSSESSSGVSVSESSGEGCSRIGSSSSSSAVSPEVLSPRSPAATDAAGAVGEGGMVAVSESRLVRGATAVAESPRVAVSKGPVVPAVGENERGVVVGGACVREVMARGATAVLTMSSCWE